MILISGFLNLLYMIVCNVAEPRQKVANYLMLERLDFIDFSVEHHKLNMRNGEEEKMTSENLERSLKIW